MSQEDLPKCPITGKDIYPSPQAAWWAAQKINRKRTRLEKTHSWGYRDKLCRHWHITSRPTGRPNKEDKQ